jgi:hypothetical protein
MCVFVVPECAYVLVGDCVCVRGARGFVDYLEFALRLGST